MRHYRVNYDVIDSRVVTLDVCDSVDIHEAEDEFIRDFDTYDEQSYSVDGDISLVSINEVDEYGNVIS
jgi:hypothetical protein